MNVKSDRSDPVVKSQACHVTVYDYYEPGNMDPQTTLILHLSHLTALGNAFQKKVLM